MSEHLQEAASHGKLEVDGSQSDIGYKLVAMREDDNAVRIKITVMAPRDWLLQQGFTNEGTLVRNGGERLPVSFDGTLDVSDAISVELDASDVICPSLEEARQRFPELGEMAG